MFSLEGFIATDFIEGLDKFIPSYEISEHLYIKFESGSDFVWLAWLDRPQYDCYAETESEWTPYKFERRFIHPYHPTASSKGKKAPPEESLTLSDFIDNLLLTKWERSEKFDSVSNAPAVFEVWHNGFSHINSERALELLKQRVLDELPENHRNHAHVNITIGLDQMENVFYVHRLVPVWVTDQEE